MPKQVLGDDPFDGESSDDRGDGSAKRVSRPAAKKSNRDKKQRRKQARVSRPAAPGGTGAKPARGAGGADAERARPAETETEADTPDTPDTDDATESSYGVESAWPGPGSESAAHDYGPSIDTAGGAPRALPPHTLGDDLKEIERRFRQRFLPVPIDDANRRRLPFEFLWRRWREIAMRDRSEVVDEFGRDPLTTARIEPLLEFLYEKYFRVEVEGLENLPDSGRALLVANHSGTLPYDGLMIMYAVHRNHAARREVRPLVEDFVFHFPYLGTFINRIGGVRACQENAERLLRQDQLVAVFPEGIKGVGKLYKDRYRLQRFGRGGFIKLALRTQSPIIPTAVIGAEEIHPMLGKVTWLAKSLGVPYLPVTPTFPWLGPLGLVPLPTKWYLRFGAPLNFNTEYGADAADDRILVNRLSENVRSHIQDMIDSKLAQRKSVLLG